METIIKRKIEVFDVTDTVKRFKYISPPAKKCFLTQEVKTKVLVILKTMMQHIFALPFLRIGSEFASEGLFLDDVMDNIKKDVYGDIEEIVNAVKEVLAQTPGRNCINLVDQKVFYGAQELEMMSTFLREQFLSLDIGETTSKILRRTASINNCLSDVIENWENEDKVFQTLKERFENVPEYVLLTRAVEISLSRKVEKSDLENLEVELSELDVKYATKNEPKFKLYTFYPSRKHDFDSQKVHHSYIAGYQFHKMITKQISKAPVPLKKIFNISDAIESIKYIENKETSKTYNLQKENFRKQGKVNEHGNVEELLLFHGTASSSLEGIISSNFNLDANPQQLLNKTQRKKQMVYGKGIYFSEIPAFSLMYGSGLLLCKVIPGTCEVVKPGYKPDNLSEIPEDYDSREVQSQDCEGVIHVIRKPAQILPYCIITLKKECLHPDGILAAASCSSSSTSVPPASTPSSSTSSPAAPNAAAKGEVTVGHFKPKEIAPSCNKTYEAGQTVGIFSCDTDKCEDDEICTICLEKLSSSAFVSLTKCGHKFHTDCLVNTVEHQSDPHYLQCPNCMTIHGIKTGNMPSDAKMSWIRAPKLQGLLLVRYEVADGVQDESHPNPGQPYHARGFPRLAVLPDTPEGHVVLKMLILAFTRRLTFTVGRSVTHGEDNCVTWNGIHHMSFISPKNCDNRNMNDYIRRVTEELCQLGITENDTKSLFVQGL